jgi:acetoin:2,6-dichlorophenolindophenol oxidoreductase subunit alpha
MLSSLCGAAMQDAFSLNSNMTNDLKGAYKRMLYLRVAEQELVKMYLDNKIFSMVHFYVGQEAVAVGVSDALKPEDKVIGNHRSHGHYLAKGGNLERMVAELLGRATGVAKGKGGSMHMIDRSVNFVGSTPILGAVAPIASGIAFEQRYNNKKDITVGFFGDGASEEGIVYETYNIAGLFKLPLLLVIENNLFAINSRVHERRAPGYDLPTILEGFGMMHDRADGNDYEDVHAKASSLIERIRTEGRPAVLECVTYRHMAHSTPLMDEKYRTHDTAEERAEKDAVTRLKAKLIAAGTAESELDAMEAELRSEVLADIAKAKEAPYPEKETMFTDMYAQ